MQNTIRTLTALIVGLMVAGCGSRPEPVTTNEPLSLPPTRPPATLTRTSTATPAPTPTRAAPTATQTPTPRPTAPPTPTPEPTPVAQESPTPDQSEDLLELIPIGELSAAMVGQQVTIEGNVVNAESFSGGFKFTLDDGSGQTALVLRDIT